MSITTKRTFHSVLLGVSIVMALSSFGVCHAENSEIEENSEQNEKFNFENVRSAIVNKDIVKLSENVTYPFEICENNYLKVLPNKEAFQQYGFNKFFDNVENFIAKFVEHVKTMDLESHMCEVCSPDIFYNVSYFDESSQVYIGFQYNNLQGIFGYNNSECVNRMPKIEFCGDLELDAYIGMLVNENSYYDINTEYENFLDHKYSYVKFPLGDEIDIMLDNKKLHLKRDPNSFSKVKVYTDDVNEYMIIASPGQSRDLCPLDSEGELCSDAQYVHIFKRPKGVKNCGSSDIVLADKYKDNFCPFNALYNAEIRLYDGIYKRHNEVNGIYTNEAKDTKLTIKDDPTYNSLNIFDLSYQGKQYTYNNNGIIPAYTMKVDDKEVLIVLEGKIDQKLTDAEFYNSSFLEYDYTKTVLFMRDKEGNCQRIPLSIKEQEKKVGAPNE